MGLIAAGIVNLDGLVRYTANPSLEPGGLNPLLAPVALVVVLLGVIRWRGWDIPLRSPQRRAMTSWLVMVGIVVLVAAGAEGSQLGKLARDIVYLTLLFLSFILILALERHERVDIRLLARTVAGVTLGIGPALAIGLEGFTPDQRFGGLVLSYPVFASVSLLAAVLVLLRDDSRVWRSAAAVAAVVWILVSGTRSVLVMALGLLPYLWLVRRPAEEVEGSRLRVGLALGLAGVAVGLLVLLVLGGGATDQLRALSVSDVGSGSLASRVAWVAWTWGGIEASGYIGGFGAGASEAALGVLPHFDLLRFWNDYSIFGLAAFLVLLLSMIFRSGEQAGLVTGAGLFLLMIGLSVHNFMQTPGTTLLAGFVLGLGSVRAQDYRLPRPPDRYDSVEDEV